MNQLTSIHLRPRFFCHFRLFKVDVGRARPDPRLRPLRREVNASDRSEESEDLVDVILRHVSSQVCDVDLRRFRSRRPFATTGRTRTAAAKRKRYFLG